MAREAIHLVELRERDQAGAQAIVDVVIVVGDFVGEVANLRFQRWPAILEETSAEFAQLARPLRRAMLEYALACLETQFDSVKSGIVFLEQVYCAQALQIVLETAVIPHAGIQGILPRMPERRVAQVVRQRNGLDQILVESQGTPNAAGNLRNFDAMRQPGAEQVALVIDEHLGLVFEPPKSRGMDDAVAIALKFAALRRRRFGNRPATRIG